MNPLTPYEQWQLLTYDNYIPEVEQEERPRGEDIARWIETQGEQQLFNDEKDY